MGQGGSYQFLNVFILRQVSLNRQSLATLRLNLLSNRLEAVQAARGKRYTVSLSSKQPGHRGSDPRGGSRNK
jgi:prophage tail gpP-like protein